MDALAPRRPAAPVRALEPLLEADPNETYPEDGLEGDQELQQQVRALWCRRMAWCQRHQQPGLPLGIVPVMEQGSSGAGAAVLGMPRGGVSGSNAQLLLHHQGLPVGGRTGALQQLQDLLLPQQGGSSGGGGSRGGRAQAGAGAEPCVTVAPPPCNSCCTRWRRAATLVAVAGPRLELALGCPLTAARVRCSSCNTCCCYDRAAAVVAAAAVAEGPRLEPAQSHVLTVTPAPCSSCCVPWPRAAAVALLVGPGLELAQGCWLKWRRALAVGAVGREVESRGCQAAVILGLRFNTCSKGRNPPVQAP